MSCQVKKVKSAADLLGLVRAVVTEGLVGLIGLVGLSGAGVLDISDVARVTVDVISYLLDATVGKLHVVGALGVVIVAGLLVAELVAGGIVIDGPVEVVVGFGGLVGLVGLVGL